MPALSAEDIAKKVLALLPADGSPILNRAMRLMVARDTGTDVTEELYAKAREILSTQNKIGRLRGPGGQIFLTQNLLHREKNERPSESVPEHQVWTEKDLMIPARRYLEDIFKRSLDLPDNCFSVVRDTSNFGPQRGRFVRPDFILVTAMSFDLMPSAQVDVHSFELKAEFGATDVAVYEALAQTRSTHFGHLIWHLPDGSRAENRLVDITEQCIHHGIGFIRMRDPENIDKYEIILDAERKETTVAAVEAFLSDRLKGKEKEDLRLITRGQRV